MLLQSSCSHCWYQNTKPTALAALQQSVAWYATGAALLLITQCKTAGQHTLLEYISVPTACTQAGRLVALIFKVVKLIMSVGKSPTLRPSPTPMAPNYSTRTWLNGCVIHDLSLEGHLTCFTSHSMPSCKPVPALAEQPCICHGLSLIRNRFRASAMSSADMALMRSCLLARTRTGTPFILSSCKHHSV